MVPSVSERKKYRFTKKFTQNFDDDSNKGYIREVDVSCPKRLRKIHNDIYFLPGRGKIEKSQKLACNMYDKKKCLYTKLPKVALGYGQIIEKVHRVLELIQGAWLTPRIDIKSELRAKAKKRSRKTSSSYLKIMCLKRLWRM